MTSSLINDRDWFSWDGIHRIKSALRDKALSEGLEGIELHFRTEALFQEALADKPSFRERQLARQTRTTSMRDPFHDALEQIAAGHNNPRRLAANTLAASSNKGADL